MKEAVANATREVIGEEVRKVLAEEVRRGLRDREGKLVQTAVAAAVEELLSGAGSAS